MDDEPARERILSAAEALFAERGFAATPTSRIAEHAGVPGGSVDAPHSCVAGAPRLLSSTLSYLQAVARHGEQASVDPEIDLIVTAFASGSWRD